MKTCLSSKEETNSGGEQMNWKNAIPQSASEVMRRALSK